MRITTSDGIHLKYEEAVKKCKGSGKPIYITKNGKSELVVMDISSFEKREQELQAQQLVLEAFAARLTGEEGYSLDKSRNLINKLIEENLTI